MEELKELKLGKDLVGNKDAQTLAHDLLGKIIHCADGDYLITVTEAYPADDYYSYIYRATHNEDGTKKSENEIDKNGKAYKILTDENMVGEFFLYGGMLHLACKANKAEARIELDNVLIRGAVKVEDNTLIIDDNINLNWDFIYSKGFNNCYILLSNISQALENTKFVAGELSLIVSLVLYCPMSVYELW